MSSVLRRLRGIFNAPVAAAAVDSRQSTASSKRTPTSKTNGTTKATTGTINESANINVAMAESLGELRNRVEKFKKCSKDPQFRNNRVNLYKIINLLAASRQFPMIVDVLEHQKKFEDVTRERFFVRMMHYYGKAGMFEHAREVFDEMLQIKFTPTKLSLNALLSAGIDVGKFDEVERLFKELSGRLGITPDVVSYNIVIKALCEMGNADFGVSMLQEMERKGVKPNSITFSTLLSWLYGNGRFEDGEKIWALMEKKNVIPNVKSYNARQRGLVSEKKVREAIEIFYEMDSKGIKPNVVSYNEVIRCFCNVGNAEEAKKWHTKLRESACKPDMVTYVTLIPFFCSKGDFDMALELCEEAIKKRVILGAALFQPVIDGLVKESRSEEANDLLELGKSRRYFWYKLNLPSVE